MRILFNYGKNKIPIEIPDENFAWTASPKNLAPIKDEEETIRKSIQNPIEMEDLNTLVKKYGRKTVILVDDLTRNTPQKRILPILFDELNMAGVEDKDMTIIIALGTHRKMTDEEILNHYGREAVDRVKIVNHDCCDEDNLVYIGETSTGVPISVNRLYYESDISIAVGNIVPHIYAGWSGGAKMVQPGVSSDETTASTHLIATKYMDSILGNPDNAIRKDMETIATETGLKMIINTVMNSDGTLAGIVTGDVVKAHREGVKIAQKLFTVNPPEKPDIVVSNSYPGDIDLWQSRKGLSSGAALVKTGGIVILVTVATEGIPPSHSELLEWGSLTDVEVREMVDKGKIKDKVAATTYISMCHSRNKAKCYIVSDIKNKDAIEKLGFEFRDDVNKLLKECIESHNGSVCRVGVVTHGADLAPEYKLN